MLLKEKLPVIFSGIKSQDEVVTTLHSDISDHSKQGVLLLYFYLSVLKTVEQNIVSIRALMRLFLYNKHTVMLSHSLVLRIIRKTLMMPVRKKVKMFNLHLNCCS